MRLYQLTESIKDFSNYVENKYDLESFWAYEKDDTITLGMIKVNDKKQGTGTAVMTELVKYADDNSKRIFLIPGLRDADHGTTSRSRLVKFYKRFGFVENKGRNKDFTLPPGMYRDPK